MARDEGRPDKKKPSLRAFVDARRKASADSERREASESERQPSSPGSSDTLPSGVHATPPEGTRLEPSKSSPSSQRPTNPSLPSLDAGSRQRYEKPIKPREVRLDESGMPLPPGRDDPNQTQRTPTIQRAGTDQARPTGVISGATRDTPPHGIQPLPQTDTGKRPRAKRQRQPFTFGRLTRLMLRLALIGTGLGLVLGFIASGVAVYYYIHIVNTVDFPSGPNRFQELKARALQFETTHIYDQTGDLLFEINDPTGGRRDYVTLDEVSPWVIHATVATEDEHFFTNPGFSIPGIIRAVYQAYQEQEVVSGASTITQQLTRALLLPPEERSEVTLRRKIKEIFISAELSRRFTKEEILELYLNQIYYGNLAYGVEAASQTYFDKPASRLNLAEASFLAGIPQTPAVWDPVTNMGDPFDPEVPPGVLDRQNQVVRLMLEAGGDGCVGPMADGTRVCVSGQDINANAADFIAIQDTVFEPPSYGAKYPHWVLYVQQELETLYDVEAIYTSGYDVYTTLDPRLQDLAQEQVEQQLASLPPEKNVNNAAIVAIDPHTGAILAMVGSRDFENEEIDGQVNMAIVPRQPGSSIKPIAYLAAFEQGWTPATVIWDVPIEYEIPGFGVYAPKNYDDRFHGPQPVRSALGNSYNTPAIQTVEFTGVPAFLQKAHDLGITSLGVVNINHADEAEFETVPGIDPALAIQIAGYRSANGDFASVEDIRNVPGIDDEKFEEIRSYLHVQEYGLSIGLGAGEVSPLEMAAAFSAMGNQGVYHKPYAIERIELNGVIDYQHPPAEDVQAVPADDAYLISSILSDNDARTPAFGANSVLNTPFTAAAKTGTTNDFRDNWTVGFHPNLALAVWVGNADNSQMVDISGVTGAGPIWRSVMEGATEWYPAADFLRPTTIFEQTVCSDSGALPSVWCTHTHTEQFSEGHPPPDSDEDIYRELLIHSFTGLIANENCPDHTQKEFFVVVPDHAKEWLLNNPAGIGWAEERGIEPEDIKDPPEEECQPGTPYPTIEITAPGAYEWLEGEVRVRGTVDVEDFDTYIVQVGEGENPGPDDWLLIQGDTAQKVTDGVLAVWDTRDYTDGLYSVRVVVFDTQGNEGEERVVVNVANPESGPPPDAPPQPPPSEPTKEPPLVPTEEPTGEPTEEPPVEEPTPEETKEPPL